jgi:hypothetical protein
MNRAEADRDAVPGVDCRDRDRELDQLFLGKLAAQLFVHVIRCMGLRNRDLPSHPIPLCTEKLGFVRLSGLQIETSSRSVPSYAVLLGTNLGTNLAGIGLVLRTEVLIRGGGRHRDRARRYHHDLACLRDDDRQREPSRQRPMISRRLREDEPTVLSAGRQQLVNRA